MRCYNLARALSLTQESRHDCVAFVVEYSARMNVKRFQAQLFGITMVCWIASEVLIMYGCYYMVSVYKQVDADMAKIRNDTSIPAVIVTKVLEPMMLGRARIYNTTRILGIWGNVVLAVGVVFVLAHSFKYFDDYIKRFMNCCDHIIVGLLFDALWAALAATTFVYWGSDRSQEGTAFATASLIALLIGSICIIKYGIDEEKSAAAFKEARRRLRLQAKQHAQQVQQPKVPLARAEDAKGQDDLENPYSASATSAEVKQQDGFINKTAIAALASSGVSSATTAGAASGNTKVVTSKPKQVVSAATGSFYQQQLMGAGSSSSTAALFTVPSV
jgi:hypothetical protein